MTLVKGSFNFQRGLDHRLRIANKYNKQCLTSGCSGKQCLLNGCHWPKSFPFVTTLRSLRPFSLAQSCLLLAILTREPLSLSTHITASSSALWTVSTRPIPMPRLVWSELCAELACFRSFHGTPLSRSFSDLWLWAGGWRLGGFYFSSYDHAFDSDMKLEDKPCVLTQNKVSKTTLACLPDMQYGRWWQQKWN